MNSFNRNIPLDVYRGILAIIVATGHYFYWLGDGNAFPISFILSVDFFFVLSGYVLTYPILMNTKDDIKSFSINFIRSRFFRLFPLYLFLVIPLSVASSIIYKTQPNIVDWVNIVGLLNIFPINSDSGFNIPLEISWSISAEFWIGIFYFPVVFIYRRQVGLYLILSFIAIASLLMLIAYSPQFMDVHYHKLNDILKFSTIRALLGFCIGSIVAYILHQYKFGCAVIHSSLQVILLMIVIMLYGHIDYNRNYEYIAPLIFGLFILSIASEKGVLYDIFNNATSQYLGKISYSIYLSHPIFVTLFKQGYLERNFLLYLILVLVFSSVLYVIIEKPFIKYGKKIKYEK